MFPKVIFFAAFAIFAPLGETQVNLGYPYNGQCAIQALNYLNSPCHQKGTCPPDKCFSVTDQGMGDTNENTCKQLTQLTPATTDYQLQKCCEETFGSDKVVDSCATLEDIKHSCKC